MGKYNGAVITTAGQNIIAESISGTLLEWTVMRSSSIAIPAGTNLEALTSLTGIEQSTHITDASVYGNNVLQVSARFSNTRVSTAYLIQTVGIYGQLTGGSETLIAVMTAVTPDEMPVYDPGSPSAFIYNTQVSVTNADSVTMVVNDTGTATVADLNRKVDISGGDVSDTVVNTVVAESAEYPVPAAGDTVKVIIGKIAKFFADIVRPFTGATASANGAKGLVPAPSAGQQTAYMRGDGQWAQPQNNATTTQNGYVLDAKMGKTLQDQITTLNDALTREIVVLKTHLTLERYGKMRCLRAANYGGAVHTSVGLLPSDHPGGLVRTIGSLNPSSSSFAVVIVEIDNSGIFSVYRGDGASETNVSNLSFSMTWTVA